jgi:hypothetical protein
VTVGFLVVWLLLDVSGFRPVLAREWHVTDCFVPKPSCHRSCQDCGLSDLRASMHRYVLSVLSAGSVKLLRISLPRPVDLVTVELTRFGSPEFDRCGERDYPYDGTKSPDLNGTRTDALQRGDTAQAEGYGGQNSRPAAAALVFPRHPQPDDALHRSGVSCLQHLPSMGFDYGAQEHRVPYSDAGGDENDD